MMLGKFSFPKIDLESSKQVEENHDNHRSQFSEDTKEDDNKETKNINHEGSQQVKENQDNQSSPSIKNPTGPEPPIIARFLSLRK